MGMIYFDTLKFVTKLEMGGFTPQQSKALSDAFKETIADQLVTTGQLLETENRVIIALRESEQRLTTAIKDVDTKLSTAIKDVDTKLSTAIKDVDTKLSTAIKDVDTKLTSLIKESELKSDAKHEATKGELYKVLLAQTAFYVGALFFIFRFFK